MNQSSLIAYQLTISNILTQILSFDWILFQFITHFQFSKVSNNNFQIKTCKLSFRLRNGILIYCTTYAIKSIHTHLKLLSSLHSWQFMVDKFVRPPNSFLCQSLIAYRTHPNWLIFFLKCIRWLIFLFFSFYIFFIHYKIWKNCFIFLPSERFLRLFLNFFLSLATNERGKKNRTVRLRASDTTDRSTMKWARITVQNKTHEKRSFHMIIKCCVSHVNARAFNVCIWEYSAVSFFCLKLRLK